MGLNNATGLAAGSVDLASFQKERREGLTKFGSLTQDVIQTINSTIKNAIASGQMLARVQTLHLSQHYSYSSVQPFPFSSRPLHDDLTMEPFTNTRVNLAERARELVEWLEDQEGIECICTCLKVKEELLFGKPSLADHMYIVALIKPPAVEVVFEQSIWMNKCYNAIRVGANVVHLHTIEKGKDFQIATDTTISATTLDFQCKRVCHFLTMQPIADKTLILHQHLKLLLEWIHESPFDWLVALQGERKGVVVVILK